MNKIMIMILSLLLPLSAFASGVKEDKVYEFEENFDGLGLELTLPDFVTEENYHYRKESYEESTWHIFNINDGAENIGNSLMLLNNLDKIVPSVITLEEVLKVYGIPSKVIIAHDSRQRNHLNLHYDDLSLYFGVYYDVLKEIRIEETSNYAYEEKISFGDPLQKVMDFLPPDEIIENELIDWEKSNVLFKNIEGRSGFNYIDYKLRNLRIFFGNNEVSAIYLY